MSPNSKTNVVSANSETLQVHSFSSTDGHPEQTGSKKITQIEDINQTRIVTITE